jgi:hypothetical protein
VSLNTTDLPRSNERRHQDWRRHCRGGCPVNLCSCIDICECGHFRIQHDYDYATDTGSSWGMCEASECEDEPHGCPTHCSKFAHAEEDQ